MTDLIKIKGVYTNATYLPVSYFEDTKGTIVHLFNKFSHHVLLQIETAVEKDPRGYEMIQLPFFKDLISFGMTRLSGKYFTIKLMEAEGDAESSDLEEEGIFTDASYSYKVIVFMNSEEDRDMFINEWCLIRKLTD